jgi:hypothetical protein
MQYNIKVKRDHLERRWLKKIKKKKSFISEQKKKKWLTKKWLHYLKYESY